MSLQDNLKQLKAYAANLEQAKRSYVAVGLPAEKVGGKIYGDGLSVIQIGAIHEYGADFTHPGGTPYVIREDGKATFVPKGTEGATGVTKPHRITIPQRSFLRVPFGLKADSIDEFVGRQFAKVFDGQTADKALNLIGLFARNISVDAFSNQGYGTWPDITSATKAAKGSSTVLIDTGTLRNSITWAVRS